MDDEHLVPIEEEKKNIEKLEVELEEFEEKKSNEKVINPLSRKYLIDNGYEYSGVCNKRKKEKTPFNTTITIQGGDVPVPDKWEEYKVLVDHKGDKQVNGKWERLWIEDKGWVGLSTILEGFAKVQWAVLNGGGKGLLSVPTEIFELIVERKDIFSQMAFEGMGILDAPNQKVFWF